MKFRAAIVVGVVGALVAAIVGFAFVGSSGGTTSGTAAPAALKWTPPRGLRWQYQLQGTVNTTICTVPFAGGACVHPGVFDIDLYAANGTTLNTAAVNQIHARHAHAVCYVDAGTSEDWRPDAAKIPAALMGKSNGWPGERWLDIRKTAVLLPIIKARTQKCVQAGFDAVDYDNVDGYTNVTGFPLTAANQLAFNRALAQLAHGLGLAVGLKNDIEQVTALRPDFEFAVNEQCFQYRECGVYDAWKPAGTPVLEVEYSALPKNYCPAAYAGGRAAIYKQLSMLATPWQTCR